MSVFSETSLPRNFAGDISAMYMGVTIETPPTAIPRKVRAAASAPTPPASAHQTEPRTKRAPPTMSVRRRPSASATAPPPRAPMAAPTSSMDVTSPSCPGDMLNSGVIKSSAPLITPVS